MNWYSIWWNPEIICQNMYRWDIAMNITEGSWGCPWGPPNRAKNLKKKWKFHDLSQKMRWKIWIDITSSGALRSFAKICKDVAMSVVERSWGPQSRAKNRRINEDFVLYHRKSDERYELILHLVEPWDHMQELANIRCCHEYIEYSRGVKGVLMGTAK